MTITVSLADDDDTHVEITASAPTADAAVRALGRFVPDADELAEAVQLVTGTPGATYTETSFGVVTVAL